MREEYVARGAALLDRVRPEWAKEINLDKFEMDDGENCALGQLYGKFSDGCKVLFNINKDELPTSTEDVEHGFAIENLFDIPEEGYNQLQELWVKEIELRCNT